MDIGKGDGEGATLHRHRRSSLEHDVQVVDLALDYIDHEVPHVGVIGPVRVGLRSFSDGIVSRLPVPWCQLQQLIGRRQCRHSLPWEFLGHNRLDGMESLSYRTTHRLV